MWILQKWDVEAWTALWLRNGQVVSYSEQGNEPLGFIK